MDPQVILSLLFFLPVRSLLRRRRFRHFTRFFLLPALLRRRIRNHGRRIPSRRGGTRRHAIRRRPALDERLGSHLGPPLLDLLAPIPHPDVPLHRRAALLPL